MATKIAKKIPIPPSRRGRPPVHPFKEMKVGDSLFLNVPQSSAAGYYKWYVVRYGWKFTTRKELDGVRIWRIE